MKHILGNKDLDYFVGSVHFVDTFANGKHWNIDTSYELFNKGLKEIFRSDFRQAATRFYELTRQMIEEDKPDIVGHIDKIKMYNNKGKFFIETDKWYQDQVNLTIDTLKKKNCIVEINTRGYYKYQQTELYPSEWIIEKMRNAGIRLMINSDAHHSSEITKGMEFAAKRLKTLCVEKLWPCMTENGRIICLTMKGYFSEINMRSGGLEIPEFWSSIILRCYLLLVTYQLLLVAV